MESSMEITGAHLQVVIWIVVGKHPQKCSIQQCTIQSSSFTNSLRRENFQFSAISMATADAKIFSCMAAIFLLLQRTREYSLSFSQTFAPSLSTITLALEIKNQRSPQPEWLFLMSLNNIRLSTQLSPPSVEMMLASMPSIIFRQRTFNRQA